MNNQNAIEELLVHSENVVAHGVELLGRHKRLIADMRRLGLKTDAADRLLETFESTHSSHIHRRDRLRRELRQTQAARAV